MNKVATIILNRNLPKPTDQLYEHLIKYDQEQTDIFVLEAGSDPKIFQNIVHGMQKIMK